MRVSGVIRLLVVGVVIVLASSCVTHVRYASSRDISSDHGYVAGRFTEKRMFLEFRPQTHGTIRNVDTDEMYRFDLTFGDDLRLIELPPGRYIISNLFRIRSRSTADGGTERDVIWIAVPDALEREFVVLDGRATYIGDITIDKRGFLSWYLCDAGVQFRFGEALDEFAEEYTGHGLDLVPSDAAAR